MVQACTRPVDGGSRIEVRVRLDNRRAAHTHLGGASAPDGRSRSFRVAAGRVSGVRSLVVSRSALVTMGIGETDGQGLGDSCPARDIARC
ncbi:hypothetical protein [Nocardioides sp. CFH 31398]|uniref:hypothetical protein n=1 Tax=Nocardioides sp. CFH 31398 TaxID=2919579 RepID=UPI001F059D60|nr:hypothetical protein [Nocardioides sp. CFH 31398]MCH1865624.1 hypothetical protein [Nocardioides sp. CFH 31398]